MPTIDELRILQALPLPLKVARTKQRIREAYDHFGGDVYVSFSGGADSTVLLDIVRKTVPNCKVVFFDTGLEFTQIRNFVRSQGDVTFIRPKMDFITVIKKYGYPFISKEVAQCVYGARRYLKNNGGGYKYHFDRLNGLGKYAPPNKSSQTNGATDEGQQSDGEYP